MPALRDVLNQRWKSICGSANYGGTVSQWCTESQGFQVCDNGIDFFIRQLVLE